MPVIPRAPSANKIDQNNSTSTPLGISGVFTGTATEVYGYNTITVLIYSDESSVDDGMQFQQSSDGTNWDEIDTFTLDVLKSESRRFQFTVQARYFRLVYTNGITAQTAFRVQTILHDSNVLTSIHRVDKQIDGDRSSQIVKAVIAGRSTIEDDTYENVRVTKKGAMLISQDGINYDAFGRQRVSNVSGIFEHKQTVGNCPCIVQNVSSGVGATFTYEKNKARSVLEVGSADLEYQLFQTMRYFQYVPGKGQLILMTGNLRGHETSVYKRIGSFDDRNGLFFESDGTNFNVVRRYYNTGTAQEERVPSTAFNIDKLDGTGPSGIVFDVTKAHIFTIQFQWLGVGEVVFALNIFNEFGDNIIPIHSMHHANEDEEVYISTPTLPMRYEIRKYGVTTGPHLMDAVCMSVATEGGSLPQGREYSKNIGWGIRTVGTARTPVFAVRLSNLFEADVNRITARFLNWITYTNDRSCYFEVAHVHAPVFVGATWTQVSSTSAVEFSTDLTAAAGVGTIEKVISQSLDSAAKGGAVVPPVETAHVSLNRFISQNIDSTESQAFVIYATAISGTTAVDAGITWVEFD